MKGNLYANILTAIDIGTTKISVLIAQYAGNEIIDIIGIGKAPSQGLKKGIVVDISKTVQSIKTAIKEAELMAGCKVESASIGIAGAHIQSYNSHGAVPIKRSAVSKLDMAQVIASAKAIALPEGQQILHVIPQHYIIDGNEPVQNPLGMHGIRLESRVHIITGSVSSVQDLITCCQSAGVQVHDVVLEQLASSHAVLTDDERELGVGLLDIGGGTSDFALYYTGGIRHTKVFPIAGNHFTQDLAVGLCASLADAERIKKEFGTLVKEYNQENMYLDIEHVHQNEIQKINQDQVYEILHARAQELFEVIKKEVDKNQLQSLLQTGLVITGGGSLLKGIDTCAQKIFQVPTRCAQVSIKGAFSQSLSNPIYATGYGLLLHALKKMDTTTVNTFNDSTVSRIFERMKSWISDFL